MDEINDQLNADQTIRPVPAATEGSAKRTASYGLRFLLIALMAGLLSVIIGSSLVTGWVILISTEPPHEYLAVIWMVIALYSGMFVLPVALAMGWPLMYFLRSQSNWIWFLISAIAAVSLAGILSLVFPDSEIKTIASYTLIYGLCFGLMAAVLRNWLVPRKL